MTSRTAHAPMRPTRPLRFAAALLPIALLTACAQQPVQYAWSHANSGEYLFAFDARECGAADGNAFAASEPTFMACMQERGYFQVDPVTRTPLASAEPADTTAAPTVSLN